MKRLHFLSLVLLAALSFTACKNMNYKTTKSGLKYKIFEGNSKDSTKDGDVLKMNVTVKLSGTKDTVLADTYGKMPQYQQLRPLPVGQPLYGPEEVFHMLKKGDSLVAVVYIDSAIKKNLVQAAELPPYMKKGDKIMYTFKILDVFKNDSLANLDYQKEMVKDAPRQKKEQEEQMEKMRKEQEAQQKADEAALEKSGEKAKQTQQIENYLKSKGIAAVKTPSGVFVKVDNPGTGDQAATGKFVTVKYTGKKLANDSTFDGPNSFTMQVGKTALIRGFEEGIKQFRQGGKGTIYIPGYLAYGKNPPPGSPFKPYEALYFNVEIPSVSNTEAPPQPQVQPQQTPTK